MRSSAIMLNRHVGYIAGVPLNSACWERDLSEPRPLLLEPELAECEEWEVMAGWGSGGVGRASLV